MRHHTLLPQNNTLKPVSHPFTSPWLSLGTAERLHTEEVGKTLIQVATAETGDPKLSRRFIYAWVPFPSLLLGR